MESLTRYLEEIHLGVVEDPHTNSRVMLTERVTVCPCCRGLHTLRLERERVRCAACGWRTRREAPSRTAA